MSYKETINLFEPAFPMRGDLVKREPLMLDKWQDRYTQLRKHCNGRAKFILHDGPPYANGQLHVGHAQNKVLKDIIIRSKTLDGFDAPFVPGWDCHGLPIEINIEKKYGKNLSGSEVRAKCRSYASEQIAGQMADFKRLGIVANWENPYKTMDYKTEADTVRALGEIYRNGYLVRGLKPVHWCLDCASALAEAEVEYYDKTSNAIDVGFRALDRDKVANVFNVKLTTTNDVFAVIWTTTPWTLPANQAICVGPEIEYSLLKLKDKYIIVAKSLASSVIKRYGYDDINDVAKLIVGNVLGRELEHLSFMHPFYEKAVPIVLGEHATDDAGTGLVHTAPAHGMDDYLVGVKYHLDLHNPVDARGCYFASTTIVGGMHVFKANEFIIELLKDRGCLFANSEISHSYPCCWRHKSKIIFRTTNQWFISMDLATSAANNKSLRQMALGSIAATSFAPAWGKNRLEAMIKNRPDWCISRQRKWGSPLAFLVHKETGELHPDSYNLLQKVALLIEKEGIDAWFNLEVSDLLPESEAVDYNKLPDTMDVWFDSGVTHYSVVSKRDELSRTPDLENEAISDLYLEGSDQHRGWFQSSLLTSLAATNKAPFKQLLTHSFVVDGNGHKMSKSKGNFVSLIDAVNKYGADILRLWVASTNYTDDVSFSDEVLKRTAEVYRRLRNTLRFLLANLTDFAFARDAVKIDELVEVDKYALILLKDLQDNVVNNLYPSYQFHLITQEILLFCSETLGGFYLDILKDRLYTTKATAKARRSAQTVIYHLASSLTLLLAPILSFTSEEVWSELQHNAEDSVLFHLYHELPIVNNSEVIRKRWQSVYLLREMVLKELEAKRAEGVIGSSLEAMLKLVLPHELYNDLEPMCDELKFTYMVSQLEVLLGDDAVVVEVTTIDANKCERCWHYTDDVGASSSHSTICQRCVTNIEGDGEIRVFS